MKRGRFTVIPLTDASTSERLDHEEARQSNREEPRGSKIFHQSAEPPQDKKKLTSMSFKNPVKSNSPIFKQAKLISMPSSPEDNEIREARESERHSNSDKLALKMLNAFQHTLFTMFEDFLKLHNSIMIEMIEKEKSRDDLLKHLIKETSEVQRENGHLQLENAKLKSQVHRKEN